MSCAAARFIRIVPSRRILVSTRPRNNYPWECFRRVVGSKENVYSSMIDTTSVKALMIDD